MTASVFTEEYNRLTTLLVKIRKENRLTQVEIAERLGKPQSFVSKYERGERRLDVVEFIWVARAIGVAPIELLRQIVFDQSLKELA